MVETPIPITNLRRVSQIASGCGLTLQLLVHCSDAVFQDDYDPPRASLPLWVGRLGLPSCDLLITPVYLISRLWQVIGAFSLKSKYMVDGYMN